MSNIAKHALSIVAGGILGAFAVYWVVLRPMQQSFDSAFGY